MYFTKVKIYEKDKVKGKGGGSDPDAASHSALHCQNWQDQRHTESIAGHHFDKSNSRSKKSWSWRSRWSSQHHWSVRTPTTLRGGGDRRQWCSNPRMREKREGTHRDEEARGSARQSMTKQGRSWHAANWKWKSDMQQKAKVEVVLNSNLVLVCLVRVLGTPST